MGFQRGLEAYPRSINVSSITVYSFNFQNSSTKQKNVVLLVGGTIAVKSYFLQLN